MWRSRYVALRRYSTAADARAGHAPLPKAGLCMWRSRSVALRRCSTAAAKGSGTSAAQEIASHLFPVNRALLARDVASAGALTLAADVICQSLFEPRSAPFDTRRAIALGTFGAGYTGLFVHFLYRTYTPLVMLAVRRLPPACNTTCTATSTLRSALLQRDSVAHACACAIVDNVALL